MAVNDEPFPVVPPGTLRLKVSKEEPPVQRADGTWDVTYELIEDSSLCLDCGEGHYRSQPTPNWPNRRVCDCCGRIRVGDFGPSRK